jgi:hypothetical protein
MRTGEAGFERALLINIEDKRQRRQMSISHQPDLPCSYCDHLCFSAIGNISFGKFGWKELKKILESYWQTVCKDKKSQIYCATTRPFTTTRQKINIQFIPTPDCQGQTWSLLTLYIRTASVLKKSYQPNYPRSSENQGFIVTGKSQFLKIYWEAGDQLVWTSRQNTTPHITSPSCINLKMRCESKRVHRIKGDW